ncbi:MAG: LTA synthase family protein [Bacteroidota bacterium]
MRELLTPVKRLSLQLSLLLTCYFVCRCCFLLFNIGHFEDVGVLQFASIAFHGIRFDISVILLINALYILLLFLPYPRGISRPWDGILQVLFISVNSIAIVFEACDWAYYSFTLKRATADVLDMINRKGDFLLMLPRFVVEYWYVPFSVLLLVLALVKGNKKIVLETPLTITPSQPATSGKLIQKTVRFIIVLGVSVIIRGGFQRTPLSSSHAVEVTESSFVPLVLNTPFTIIHSLSGQALVDPHYYSEEELDLYNNPLKQYSGKVFTSKNVVVIMLESFSKQFTGLGERTSYTPFLDSLMDGSFVCRRGYANALHSAEGVPAVISGIPSLMDEPITTSNYGANSMTSLPDLLKQKGYETAFFHGGTNGTMGFDLFSSNAGYDHYFGRDEYDNEDDYDGDWGIWDEPFLQYYARTMSEMRQPFFTSVLTLTSHDPFRVPDQYKLLPKGPLPVQQCIAYTDMSLRKFFRTAASQSWYNNTLFVITADHCSLMTENNLDHNNLGFYAIPIVFFSPGDSSLQGSTRVISQQIDILPSVLDYLGYEKPFFAFGNSVFRGRSEPDRCE